MLEGLPTTGPTDPIGYYRRPGVGWLFRKRINIGLHLLEDRRYAKALEVGYGAGAVLLAIAPAVDELHGIDLDADPAQVEARLAEKGRTAQLHRASVYELPYEDRSFDLVASFSVFEHLTDYRRALTEVGRVLEPGGHFLLGMPAVNRAMEAGFRLIGFKKIGDFHVTTPAAVANSFDSAWMRTLEARTLQFPLPGIRLYYTWLLETSGLGP